MPEKNSDPTAAALLLLACKQLLLAATPPERDPYASAEDQWPEVRAVLIAEIDQLPEVLRAKSAIKSKLEEAKELYEESNRLAGRE